MQAIKLFPTDFRRHLVWKAKNAKILSVNELNFGLRLRTLTVIQNFKTRVYQLAIIFYPLKK